MKRAYIEMRECARMHRARVLYMDEVHVEVSKTASGYAQYCVMGHDQITGGWYPVSSVWRELDPAWEACEDLHRQITAKAMAQREGARHGSTM